MTENLSGDKLHLLFSSSFFFLKRETGKTRTNYLFMHKTLVVESHHARFFLIKSDKKSLCMAAEFKENNNSCTIHFSTIFFFILSTLIKGSYTI